MENVFKSTLEPWATRATESEFLGVNVGFINEGRKSVKNSDRAIGRRRFPDWL